MTKQDHQCPNCGAFVNTVVTQKFIKYVCQGCGLTRIEKGVKVAPSFVPASDMIDRFI